MGEKGQADQKDYPQNRMHQYQEEKNHCPRPLQDFHSRSRSHQEGWRSHLLRLILMMMLSQAEIGALLGPDAGLPRRSGSVSVPPNDVPPPCTLAQCFNALELFS